MRVWLDDVRPMPEGFDLWVKNYYIMLGLLVSGNVAYISFDHDLGLLEGETKLDPYNTGYQVAKTIEEWAYRYQNGLEKAYLPPIGWEIHSANPVGRKNIELAMKSAERFWNQ